MTTARVLIVEDEHLIALGLRRRLTAMGHTVVGLAASGEEAVARADVLQPDVILMDICLRGAMDGVEAARSIRARAPIPVIYLSAFMDAPTLTRARQTVPVGYLVKPVSDQALRTAVERALKGPSAPA